MTSRNYQPVAWVVYQRSSTILKPTFLSTGDNDNYRSLWRQAHFDVTDKNNNASFEDLDIHYHPYHSLTAILAIMSVSTFKAAVILYLISLRDIVSINTLTLVLKTIGQCDVISHYDVIDKKTITSVLNVSTNTITTLTANFISSLKTRIQLYLKD